MLAMSIATIETLWVPIHLGRRHPRQPVLLTCARQSRITRPQGTLFFQTPARRPPCRRP
jgi:hypothetical protein